MSLLCLTNEGERYLISSDLWTDLLSWAEETGWKPCAEPEAFREIGRSITAEDAANLADVFEVMAGHLIFVQANVSEDFLRELGTALESLAEFFDSGRFEIQAANPHGPHTNPIDPSAPMIRRKP